MPYIWIHVCMCIDACMYVGQFSAVNPLLPCEAQRPKPVHEAWQPAPLPAEPLQRL